MQLPHVQYFNLDIKSNYLEKIRNAALCYCRSWVIESFIGYIREMYGKSWETKMRLIRVIYQSKYFWREICIGIDLLMICRIVSLW